MNRPRLIGITGGLACGKSEVGRILRRLGVPVWEADEAVHARLRPRTRETRAIARRFGTSVLRADGAVARDRLAAIVFRDAARRRELEAILHPPVLRDLRAWVRRMSRRRCPALAAIVPLLFEIGIQGTFDTVLCVAANRATVLERLRRRGIGPAEARRRLAAQWPVRRKCRAADYVIWNNGTRAELARAVRRWWMEWHQEGD
ncbi:MAG: dephospho-CoA kinase [Kiritimatiellae bacterium]|nr:dephospho-CoA kinase [Kiritimatiellia bacterium]